MADKIKDAKDRAAAATEELDLDSLENVSGGAQSLSIGNLQKNPFAGVDRVIVNDIDDDLRNKI